MRLGLFLGLGLLACGGEAGRAQFDPTAGGQGGAGAAPLGTGAKPAAGSQNAPQGGQGEGGSAVPPGGQAGAPAAGMGGQQAAGQGGQHDAGQGGGGGTAEPAEGGASGAGGSPDPPDDTGCVERPLDGNPAGQEPVKGLDCSSCTNAAKLGYSIPAWCETASKCTQSVDLTTLGADDVFVLLPPGAAAEGACKSQACDGSSGPEDLPGFNAQYLFTLPAGSSVKIEVDAHRRVLKRDQPLFECADVSTCASYASAAQFVIVAEPDAPRGWARIRFDAGACE